MAKRNRGRRYRRSQFGDQEKGPVFFQHPFTGLPREKLVPALVEHAKLSRERYHSVLSEILDVLRSADPLQTITALAAFGLTTPVDSDGVGGSWLNNDRFSQSHVELIQALALALPAENWSHTPPNPSQIQKLFDLLPVLADAFAHQRMAIMGQNRSDEHKAVTMVQVVRSLPSNPG